MWAIKMEQKKFDILLVEDSMGDIRLIQKVLKDRTRNRLHVVRDGDAAMHFLKREEEYADAPRPSLILLDLNLPKKDGRQVLKELKDLDGLASIPVIVLSTSTADRDIIDSYKLRASCFVTKPSNLDQFVGVIRSIEDFWLSSATLPEEA